MTTFSPIGRDIQRALAASLRREPDAMQREHHLRDDLGLDSLMVFELLYELEQTYDMEIPNEDLPGLNTLGDVIDYVEARVAAAAGKTPGASRARSAPVKTGRGTPPSSAAPRRTAGKAATRKPVPAKRNKR